MSIRPFAVVTGGSSGIGLEMARDLARRGHDLLICSENAAELARAAQDLAREGTDVDSHVADLAIEDGVAGLIGAVEDRAVDVLCVNAGVGKGGPFAQTDLDAELRMIDLNCRGAVQLVKGLLPAMLARRQGRILITSSIAATMPAPFEAVYGATKVFLRWFAQGLREEVREQGITVTALMPSTTETNFFRRAGMMDTRAGTMKKDSPELVARAGIAGLMAGRDHVVPTLKNKAMGTLADHLPDTVGARMHRGLTEPGSARDEAEDDSVSGLAPLLVSAAVIGGAAWWLSRPSRNEPVA